MNGWQGTNWGHYFPVDISISEALGSDFDFLVIPGGERGTAKLKTNPHTRRIINHFIEAEKPIAAIEWGVSLLALSPRIKGCRVTTSENAQEALLQSEAVIADGEITSDRNILTADGSDITAWVNASLELIGNQEEVSVAA